MEIRHLPVERKDVDEIERVIRPMQDLLSKYSFTEHKKPFDIRYAELMACADDYFEHALIPAQKRKIMFGAYAPLHRHVMTMAYSAGLEKVLPFGAVWSHFSRVYFLLELDKFQFGGDQILESIESLLEKSSYVVEMAAVQSLRRCVQPSVMKSKRNRQVTEVALQNFKKVVAAMGRPLHKEVHDLLSLFEVHFRSFIVQLQMRECIRKINEYVVREAIFYEKEPSYDAQEAMRHFFSFMGLFLRIMYGSNEAESNRKMREWECAASLFKRGHLASFEELKSIIVQLAGRQTLGDTTELRNELSTYFATHGVENWAIGERCAKLMKMKQHVECNHFKPFFNLVSNFTQFIAENRLDDVNYNGLVMRLLASYSVALVKVKVMEDFEAVQSYMSKIGPAPKEEKSLPAELETMMRHTRELLDANVTTPEFTMFLKRFLISTEIASVLCKMVMTSGKPLEFGDMLRFIPDLRGVGRDVYLITSELQATAASEVPRKPVICGEATTDWRSVADRAAGVYQGVLADIDRPKVLLLLENMRKVVNFESAVHAFAEAHSTGDGPDLLLADNEFASELTTLLEKAMPILRRAKLGALWKACFDLSLGVVFSGFSDPQAVSERWTNMCSQLPIPDFEVPVWYALRYAEFLAMREAQSNPEAHTCATFRQTFGQFLMEASEANASEFKQALAEAGDAIPPSWKKHYEEIVMLFDEYHDLAQEISLINTKFYAPEPFSTHVFLMIMIGNLVSSVVKVTSFALTEGLVPEAMSKVCETSCDDLMKWPRAYKSIYSITGDLASDFSSAIEALQSVTFEDVQEKLSVRCAVVSALLVNCYALNWKLDKIRPMFDELRDKIEALHHAPDFRMGLFGILGALRSLHAAVSAWDQSFETESLLVTIEQFSHFVVNSLCVLSFHTDLGMVLNALGLVKQLFGLPFTPVPVDLSSLPAVQTVQSDEAAGPDEPEKNRILAMLDEISSMLGQIAPAPDLKIDKARQTLDEIGTILTRFSDKEIVEQLEHARSGLAEITNEIHCEIAKRQAAAACLQRTHPSHIGPSTDAFMQMMDEERNQQRILVVATERHQLQLQKATERHKDLSQRLARAQAVADAPEDPSIGPIKALTSQLQRKTEAQRRPLTEQTLLGIEAIGKVKRENRHLEDRIRRARAYLYFKQATGECPIEPVQEKTEPVEAEDEIDPKFQGLQAMLAEVTMSLEHSASKGGEAVSGDAWEHDTAELEMMAYSLIEALREERAEVASLAKTRDALKDQLAEKNQRIAAVLSKL